MLRGVARSSSGKVVGRAGLFLPPALELQERGGWAQTPVQRCHSWWEPAPVLQELLSSEAWTWQVVAAFWLLMIILVETVRWCLIPKWKGWQCSSAAVKAPAVGMTLGSLACRSLCVPQMGRAVPQSLIEAQHFCFYNCGLKITSCSRCCLMGTDWWVRFPGCPLLLCPMDATVPVWLGWPAPGAGWALLVMPVQPRSKTSAWQMVVMNPRGYICICKKIWLIFFYFTSWN